MLTQLCVVGVLEVRGPYTLPIELRSTRGQKQGHFDAHRFYLYPLGVEGMFLSAMLILYLA